MGSISATPAALIRVLSLSAYRGRRYLLVTIFFSLSIFPHEQAQRRRCIEIWGGLGFRTVISMPSSARIRAAYEAASSELDILTVVWG